MIHRRRLGRLFFVRCTDHVEVQHMLEMRYSVRDSEPEAAPNPVTLPSLRPQEVLSSITVRPGGFVRPSLLTLQRQDDR